MNLLSKLKKGGRFFYVAFSEYTLSSQSTHRVQQPVSKVGIQTFTIFLTNLNKSLLVFCYCLFRHKWDKKFVKNHDQQLRHWLLDLVSKTMYIIIIAIFRWLLIFVGSMSKSKSKYISTVTYVLGLVVCAYTRWDYIFLTKI